MKQKTGEKATLSWLIAVAKGKKRYLILLTLTNIITGASTVGYALFLRQLVNSAIDGDRQRFLLNALLLLGLVILQFLMHSLYRFLDEYCRSSLENNLKHRIFQCLLHKDYASVTATHSGEWMNRLTSDTTIVANGMTQILPGLAGTVSRMVASLALLLSLVPMFGVFFVLGGGMIVLLTWVVRSVWRVQP